MDNYFVNRKTIRSFSDEKVGDELVHSLLGIASHAPTTGNMQLYSVATNRHRFPRLSFLHSAQISIVSRNGAIVEMLFPVFATSNLLCRL